MFQSRFLFRDNKVLINTSWILTSHQPHWAVWIDQWLEHRTHDQKVVGSVLTGAAGSFSSPGSTSGADSFRYLFHPCVTEVAHRRSHSFCQKCRWQVTAKHTCTTHNYVAWNEVTLQTDTWLYDVHRTCAKTVAVSNGINHVTPK